MQRVKAVFVTGPTGAGKSRYIERRVDREPRTAPLYIGKELRKLHGEAYFTGLKNSGAPTETDGEVLSMICHSLKHPITKDGLSIDTILIDGVPRKREQVEWVLAC